MSTFAVRAAALCFVAITGGGAAFPLAAAAFNNLHVPYGHYITFGAKGHYGDRMRVEIVDDAIAMVKAFYEPHTVKIRSVRERRWFYMMEVLDESRAVIDVVIVDKRSGRIRSIY